MYRVSRFSTRYTAPYANDNYLCYFVCQPNHDSFICESLSSHEIVAHYLLNNGVIACYLVSMHLYISYGYIFFSLNLVDAVCFSGGVFSD